MHMNQETAGIWTVSVVAVLLVALLSTWLFVKNSLGAVQKVRHRASDSTQLSISTNSNWVLSCVTHALLQGTIAFFHPFANGGGGGERVLWYVYHWRHCCIVPSRITGVVILHYILQCNVHQNTIPDVLCSGPHSRALVSTKLGDTSRGCHTVHCYLYAGRPAQPIQ